MNRLTLCIIVLAMVSQLRADEPPKSLDSRLKVELFAEHPQIVTPTGLDVDHRGRVFAIESNTHFPPEGYKGHPTDRVLVMSDTDADGKADKISVFTDGLKFSMSVVVRPLWFPVPVTKDAPAPKQSVYVATRAEIFQFHDDDGDDKADRKESIVRLDTKGNYPHNGLAGFAIDALGWMYFGFGENLGADYKIIGSDGTTLGGGGEGGNIYRCRLDGSKLSQVATGFWNPHANCFDAFGRLFSVDNDPDSRPPCRLLHVIPGGDYGYRFRNGRKGLHPFTSWNGEIPGTLPMVAGTGEAPSGILAYESDGLPEEYLGNLLVTSWGDHRIDRFRLQPKGTSFTSLAEPLITGGENFRPVGIATAPDGSLFCTDWVLRDYKLHGHGRIWRIAPKEARKTPVIDISAVDQKSVDQLKLLLESPRRDVRRSAVDSLGRKWIELIDVGKEAEADRMFGTLGNIAIHTRAAVETFWKTVTNKSKGEQYSYYDEHLTQLPEVWADFPYSTPALQRKGTSVAKGRASDALSTKQQIRKMVAVILSNDQTRAAEAHDLLPEITLYSDHFKRDEETLKLLLSMDDPFVMSLVVGILADRFKQDDFATYLIPGGVPTSKKFLNPEEAPGMKTSAPRVRQAMLLAARKQAPKEDRLLRVALADPDPDVRRLAVQWAAEEKLTDLRPAVEALFGREGEAPAEPGRGKDLKSARNPRSGSAGASPSHARAMTPELFLATIAALEMLDGKKPEDFDKTPAALYVVPLLKDEKRSPAVRAQALRLVSPTDKALDEKLFGSLLKSEDVALRLEAVRTLQAAQPEIAGPLLRAVADASRVGTNEAGTKEDDQRTRDASTTLASEALVGLAAVAKSEAVGGPTRKLLKSFLNNSSLIPLRFEALRAARPLIADDPELRDGVLDIAKTVVLLADSDAATNLSDQISLAFAEAKLAPPQSLKLNTSEKPKDRREWMDQLARGGNVDPAAGRRIFFHPNGPGCYRCHTIDGRGGRIGPDLSRAIGTMNRVQLIQSILEPSREIAPQYVSWTFELKDGKVVTGMVVHENEGKTVVGNAEGTLIEIKTIDIETRTPQKISVMPEKLAERMTLQELRDLLAFLDSQK